MRLQSEQDKSINLVEEQLTGFIESRYVRRTDDYFIAYLSSQTGCNRGCRFCHLTATKQTQFEDVSYGRFLRQCDSIYHEYFEDIENGAPEAKTVHVNFMARGEPFMNKSLRNDGDSLLWDIGEAFHPFNIKFNISTIMPRDMPELTDMFKVVYPTIYYSMYSTNDEFRRKWMPNAMPWGDALKMLKRYQDVSKKIVKFHGAFIKGENDSDMDIYRMINVIHMSDLHVEFNIVRYNPYSPEQGEESDKIDSIKAMFKNSRIPCKIIPRVGFDVAASCGLFVDKNGSTDRYKP